MGDSMENSFRFFPRWKRGMKGDLTAFQKAKLLRFILMVPRFRGADVWTPAFAGVTTQETFYETINFQE